MTLRRISTGEIIPDNSLAFVARGGEGTISRIAGSSLLAVKLYHRVSPDIEMKLRAMAASPPIDPFASQGHQSIAWPVDLVADYSGRIVGFLMPWVEGMSPAIDFYNPGTRRRLNPLFHYLYLMRTARNIAAGMRALHERGCIVGDLNESNVLVSNTALATWVDTDSFQVRDLAAGKIFRCPVGKAEYTPPELQGARFTDVDRQPEHDLFGLGVLLFHLLMEGTHPFSGRYTGKGDAPPIEERIKLGHFPYSQSRRKPYEPAMNAPPIKILPEEIRYLFLRCFEEGHRKPEQRPTAQEWKDALDRAEKELIACTVNNQHRYARHLATCPWCERAKLLGGRDPFPSMEEVRAGKHLPPPVKKKTTSSAHLPRPFPWWRLKLKRASSLRKLYPLYPVLLILYNLFLNPTGCNLLRRTFHNSFDPIKNMHFAIIPAGELIASNPNAPFQKVEIPKAFELQTTEVTQGQWKALMYANPSNNSVCGDDCPVENVSWDEVCQFVKNMNKRKDGRVYSLPSLAEWEYAAQVGSADAFKGDINKIAWHSENSGSHTHPVAQKAPNTYGLYDLYGNVSEWLSDGRKPSLSAEKGGLGPASVTLRAACGGNFNTYPDNLKSSLYYYQQPDFRSGGRGFRLRRTI